MFNRSKFLKGYGLHKCALSTKQPFATSYMLPEGSGRVLSQEEEAVIKEKTDRLFPDLFSSEGTPLPEMLASPGKQSLLGALALLAGTTGIGVLQGTTPDEKVSGGLKGAAVGVPLAALLGAYLYNRRHDKNEELIDILRRYPERTVVTNKDFDAKHPVTSKFVFRNKKGGGSIRI